MGRFWDTSGVDESGAEWLESASKGPKQNGFFFSFLVFFFLDF
jgi:hypothetical protein